MAPFSGLLSAVSKVVPFVGGDTNVDDTEDHEPLSTDSDSAGYLDEDESTRKDSIQSAYVHLSVRQSSSDTGLQAQAEARDVTTIATPSPVAGLRPSRLKGQRSFSNSQIETRSFARGTVSPETIRQRHIMARLSNLQRSDALKRSKFRSGSGTSIPLVKGDEATNAFEWRSSARSISDPDLQLPVKTPRRLDLGTPLKTCLKQKAKSANTTPPNEAATAVRSSVENQKLRRVKTVDFEEAISRSLTQQQRDPTSTSDHRRARDKKVPELLHSCPGAVLLARRSPACPPVTRTDVHVIAIAPSSLRSTNPDLQTTDQGDLQETDPATPIMQIVQSGNGSYEVVWDDVPPEHRARTERRNSSASQALEAASAGTKGLERVNTKLTEWSGTWNSPFDSFKPSIVVFPGDDGRRPQFECTLVDDEDIDILAPPNSERVSAVHSRRPSRPASTQMSRVASHDNSSEPVVPKDVPNDDTTITLEAPPVPDPEAWSAHLVTARRKLGVPCPDRKLSNVEEADLKFRNHRDSLTLAHGRLVDIGGVRPELLGHRDYVRIAKKRMHVGNRKHGHRLESKSESGQHADGEAATIPPLSVVKDHAAEALTHGAPAPILRHAKSASGRHIRIEEQL